METSAADMLWNMESDEETSAAHVFWSPSGRRRRLTCYGVRRGDVGDSFVMDSGEEASAEVRMAEWRLEER